MTIEEIRKNAPSGATHYDYELKSVTYWKLINNRWCWYCESEGWNDYSSTQPSFIKLL